MTGEAEISVCQKIIQQHFGQRCQIREIRVLYKNRDYLVVDLTLSNPPQRVVIKLAGPKAQTASPFDRTFAINQQVRKQPEIPTYEALAFDMSYKIVPYRYLLMSYVTGYLWATVKNQVGPAEFQPVYPALGRAVAQLHTIQYGFFGEIGSQGDVVASETDYSSALAKRATRRIPNPHHQELFLSLLQQNRELFNEVGPPRLTHEDLNPGNILLKNQNGKWQLAAIVDFDSAWAGGFESDLARLAFWRGMAGEGFFDAYQTINPVPANYPQRKRLLQLLWCLEFADPSEQHYQDTKKICETLGIAPVTFDHRF